MFDLFRSLSLLPAAVVLSLGTTFADVWIVDFTGAGDFLDVQSAVDTASDGDTILVAEGDYAGFEIVAKRLRVLANGGDDVAITSRVRIAGVPLGERVVIEGLAVSDPNLMSMRVEGCLGSVRFGNCSFTHDPSSYTGVVSSQDVAFVDCLFEGLDGDTFYDGEKGADGLRVSGSTVALYNCSLSAGDGGAGVDGTTCSFGTCGYGGPGGNGLFAINSFVFASNCVFRAGAGGPGGDAPGCPCGDGADGVDVLDGSSTLQLLDNQYVTGPSLDNLPGTSRTLIAPSIAVDGSVIELAVTGAPGESVFLLASAGTAFEFIPALVGTLLVAPPHRRLLHGPIPAHGALSFDFEVPTLAAGEPAREIFLQAITIDLATQTQTLTDLGSLVVLDPVFAFDDCNGNGLPDEQDIASGTSLDCNADGVPDECEADCNGNGVPDECDIASGSSVDGNGNGIPDECEDPYRIFVNEAQPGFADGTSWTTAFRGLQDALSLATELAAIRTEIWVARGTYAPAPPGGLINASFLVPTRTSLYGGFAGGEDALEERDWIANETVLSGDIDGDDVPGVFDVGNNSETVISMENVEDVVVDGFVVTGAASSLEDGGGLSAVFSEVRVSSCTFRDNRASSGAGCSIQLSDAVLHGCTFLRNEAVSSGAGLFISGSALISACTFVANATTHPSATLGGGGIYLVGEIDLVNCLFHRNSTASRGGGALAGHSSFETAARFVGCTISENVSGLGSGGVSIRQAFDLDFHDCVLWNNTGATADAEHDQVDWVAGATGFLAFSCVEGLDDYAGNQNIGADPLFADSDGPDDIPGTLDDDLRLSPGSPCIDSGRNQAFPDDVLDLDGDGTTGELWPLDLAGARRRADDTAVDDTGVGVTPIVDRGAFEKQD